MKKLLKDQDFKHSAEVFKLLTKHDVKALLPNCSQADFLAELQLLMKEHDEGALLLHAALSTVVGRLKDVLFAGSGHNTSSDLHCVKMMLEKPVECLLRNNDIQLPAGIDIKTISELAGAIIKSIDITVRCHASSLGL